MYQIKTKWRGDASSPDFAQSTEKPPLCEKIFGMFIQSIFHFFIKLHLKKTAKASAVF